VHITLWPLSQWLEQVVLAQLLACGAGKRVAAAGKCTTGLVTVDLSPATTECDHPELLWC